jgi:hypothetical protein
MTNIWHIIITGHATIGTRDICITRDCLADAGQHPTHQTTHQELYQTALRALTTDLSQAHGRTITPSQISTTFFSATPNTLN